MGLVAEYDIECERLPLVGVAAAVQSAELTLDLQFAHGEGPLFLVTARDGPKAALERAFEDAPDVGAYTHVGQAGDTHRYQVIPGLSLGEQLGEVVDDLAELEALATSDAIVERIGVTRSGWHQTAWFADREAFDDFRAFWGRNGGFRLQRLTHDGEPEPPGDGLTDRQREALRTAYEMGYFEIPRRASLEAVAAELGITASSASERLRRAQTRVVETTVAPTWPPLPE